MVKRSWIEVDHLAGHEDLARRVLGGEVVVARKLLQQTGLFDAMVADSLAGIRAAAGEEAARRVERDGFDRIHEWVRPETIPAVTDAIYARLTPIAHAALRRLLPAVFPGAVDYYFERSPNIRFHIPYDDTAEHRRAYARFADKRGEGKITAHGPHRDPWVDCPDNAINVWIAVGPVRQGNGLTVFVDEYRKPFAFRDGYIDWGVQLGKPLTFDLQPGDAVLFHGNHLHGSELNRTDRTRYVVSYRVTLGKPHYPHGHYHHYLHGGLAGGRWNWLAGLPQNLQWSFIRYQFRRLQYKLMARRRMTGRDAGPPGGGSPAGDSLAGLTVAVSAVPVGAIRAVSDAVCVARIDEQRFVAFGRRCPHQGGDLAGGWIDEGRLVCPLHSLPFDPGNGASPCRSIRPLQRFRCAVRNGVVHVSAEPSGGADAATRDLD
jgi:nitrite reductase/ring-hydroxylating ferredoxin subunit